jgi:hypothetical protein
MHTVSSQGDKSMPPPPSPFKPVVPSRVASASLESLTEMNVLGLHPIATASELWGEFYSVTMCIFFVF